MNKKEIISKAAVHKWMEANWGKPKRCDECGTTDENKFYDWANKDHTYRRVREDFRRLCRSCHRKYDMTPNKLKQAMSNLWWKTGIPQPGTKFVKGYKKGKKTGLLKIPYQKIKAMNRIKIKTDYPFWRHPIKWWRDRKCRRFLETYLNDTPRGIEIQNSAQEKVRELMMTGRTQIGDHIYHYPSLPAKE